MAKNDKRISFRKYAKLKGLSPSAVVQAAQAGRISFERTKKGNLVDPEIADREWESTRTRNIKEERGELGTTSSSPTEGPDGKKIPNLQHARAFRETFNARLAELELDKKLGKVIDVEVVRKAWAEVGHSIRNAILALPDRVCALVASSSDPNECHRIITLELNKVLEALSNGDRF